MEVLFNKHENIIFPHLCVGCTMPTPHAEIVITTGKNKGKVLTHESSYNIARTVAGGIAGLTPGGSAAGKATELLFDIVTGRDGAHSILLPVCENCLNMLSEKEKKQLKQAATNEPDDTFDPTINNRLFRCKVKSSVVHLTLHQRIIADAVIALNQEKIQGTEAASGIVQSTEKNDCNNTACDLTQKLALDPIDVAILALWDMHVGKIEHFFNYPDIPKKKLMNAKLRYASSLTPYDQIVALQDNTVFGSAKEGVLFTTRNIFWNTGFSDGSEHISLEDIDPSTVHYKYNLINKKIIIGQKEIMFTLVDEEDNLKAITTFIIDAIQELTKKSFNP